MQFQKRVSKPFVPTTIMTEILDAQVLGTVANGTLSVVGTKIKKTQQSCRLSQETPTGIEVEQDIYYTVILSLK